MILHHIAIGTQNLERLNEFYSRLPGVKNIEKKYSPEGYFRSFWIRFEGNILLMVEEKEKNKGPEALIFSIFNDNGNPFDLTSIQDLIYEKTDYTVYFSDPDGNKLGYSSFPSPLPKDLFIPHP